VKTKKEMLIDVLFSCGAEELWPACPCLMSAANIDKKCIKYTLLIAYLAPHTPPVVCYEVRESL
jgi:hypothetical protein